MSFLEYLNKKVLKDFGIKDFQLEEHEVKSLDKHRENFRSFQWISIFFLIIGASLLIVLFLTNMGIITEQLSGIVQQGVYFFIVASITSTLAKWRSARLFSKVMNKIKVKGLHGALIKLTPYNCVNYGEGKFIMLEESVVKELEEGDLDLEKPLNNPNKVVAIKMVEVEGNDFTCDFLFDIAKKDVSIEARVPSAMYKEFHQMCLNGGVTDD